jgi:hypothetical protein
MLRLEHGSPADLAPLGRGRNIRLHAGGSGCRLLE